MKNIIALITLIALLGLASCNTATDITTNESTQNEATTTVAEEREPIYAFPEAPADAEQLLENYRKEVLSRLERGGAFSSDEEEVLMKEMKWEFDEEEFPVIYTLDGKNVLLYTTWWGNVKIEGYGSIGSAHAEGAGALLWLDQNKSITYEKELGKITYWTFGTKTEIHIPSYSSYVGNTYGGCFYFRDPDSKTVYRVNSKGSSEIAHDVLWVISLEFDENSDSMECPVFLMEDGSIKVFSDAIPGGKLIDVTDLPEGGYKSRLKEN